MYVYTILKYSEKQRGHIGRKQFGPNNVYKYYNKWCSYFKYKVHILNIKLN